MKTHCMPGNVPGIRKVRINGAVFTYEGSKGITVSRKTITRVVVDFNLMKPEQGVIYGIKVSSLL
jgi:hypothetical protein